VATLLAPHEQALKLTRGRCARREWPRSACEPPGGGRRQPPTTAQPGGVPSGPGPRRLFARFLGLTAINPTTVLYFAALIAGLPAISHASASAKAVFVVAVGVASLSWQLTLAGSGAALHHRLPEHARLYTALAGNALVLGLAVRMALSA
jgi:threonine/homoserine/homoserine lactone efflux protein